MARTTEETIYTLRITTEELNKLNNGKSLETVVKGMKIVIERD